LHLGFPCEWNQKNLDTVPNSVRGNVNGVQVHDIVPVLVQAAFSLPCSRQPRTPKKELKQENTRRDIIFRNAFCRPSRNMDSSGVLVPIVRYAFT
jgi:hypothetical protein